MNSNKLSFFSGAILDISPRTARLLTMLGAIGVITIVVESLVGNRLETIEVDKIIHFMGYFTLAVVFIFSLRPRWCIPSLIGLAILSYLIEILQPLNMRSYEPGDAIANLLGLAIGALFGMVIRFAYGYIRTEIETNRIRRSLITLPEGTTIVRQGQMIDRFFLIRWGYVNLYRETNGEQIEVAQLGAGEMFGIVAEILKQPQTLTVVAKTAVQIYPLEYDALIKNVGGYQQPVGIVLHYMADKLAEILVNLKKQGNSITLGDHEGW